MLTFEDIWKLISGLGYIFPLFCMGSQGEIILHFLSVQFKRCGFDFSPLSFSFSLSLSFLTALTLEHRTSVISFVSLQFLNLGHSVGLLGRGISPSQGCYLHKQNKRAGKHLCFEWDSNS
jgi:hypothetical protein